MTDEEKIPLEQCLTRIVLALENIVDELAEARLQNDMAAMIRRAEHEAVIAMAQAQHRLATGQGFNG